MALEMDEQLSLLDDFISETAEHLAASEERLLKLETAPGDRTLARELLRSFHTIKGNSGYFDFREMSELAHKLESLLTPVQDGLAPLSPDGLVELLAGVDRLRGLLAAVERSRSEKAVEQAPADEEQTALDHEERYLLFEVEALVMAVPLEQVLEVARPVAVAPLPHVPPHVAGLVNLRGSVVPLIDLHRRLLDQCGLEQARHLVVVPYGRGRVALAVERVAGVATLAEAGNGALEAGALLGRAASQVRYRNGKPVALLDLKLVLAQEDAYVN